MSLISRITTWVSSQVLTSSALNGEFNNVVNTLNNLDGATTTWTNVKTGTLSITAQAASLSMNSQKITSLASGTASTDAVNFGQVGTQTDWAAYTPTLAGVGTASAVSFFWRQIGNTVYVKGFFTTGTCTGTTVSATLPNSTTINTSHCAANFTFGSYSRVYTGAGGALTPGVVFTDASDTSHVFYTPNAASNAFVKFGGSSIFTNGDSVSMAFDYPI